MPNIYNFHIDFWLCLYYTLIRLNDFDFLYMILKIYFENLIAIKKDLVVGAIKPIIISNPTLANDLMCLV